MERLVTFRQKSPHIFKTAVKLFFIIDITLFNKNLVYSPIKHYLLPFVYSPL